MHQCANYKNWLPSLKKSYLGYSPCVISVWRKSGGVKMAKGVSRIYLVFHKTTMIKHFWRPHPYLELLGGEKLTSVTLVILLHEWNWSSIRIRNYLKLPLRLIGIRLQSLPGMKVFVKYVIIIDKNWTEYTYVALLLK